MKKLTLFLILAIFLISQITYAKTSEVSAKMRVKPNITGLPNAMLRVRNESVALHLQEVLTKIQANRLETLNKLQNLTVEESETDKSIVNKPLIEATGTKEAKLFGLFKMKHKYVYNIDDFGINPGNVVRRKSFVDKFWKDTENMD